MKKLIVIILILALAGGGFYWYRHRAKTPDVIYYKSQAIKKGNVTQEVTATGTINPIKKISVTTQVTGKITSLTADYNSRVKEGDTIAMIDPETYKSALASAKAQLKNNQAALEKTRAQLTYAKKELERQKKLSERGMTTDSDLDSAQATYDELVATEKSNEAAIEQSEAAEKTAETNLSYCTISSPVTGIVITRSVEEGQTVVSSMSATALFTIATDLSRIQVEAAVPEADIGGIKVGQTVNFTVDAYKTQFTGKVTEIRLSSTTTSNVVTYPVIVQADNPGEKLFPGMTANLSVIIAETDNALVIPNAALRFTPVDTPAKDSASEGNAEAMQPPQPRKPGAKTIWIADSDTEIHPVEVEIGITDGINTVILDSDKLNGQKVATGKQSAAAAKAAAEAAANQTTNPFMPKRPGGTKKGNGGPGGGPGGPPPA